MIFSDLPPLAEASRQMISGCQDYAQAETGVHPRFRKGRLFGIML
jgi:hypothetical protein